MPSMKDGPSTSQFAPIAVRGNVAPEDLAAAGVSKTMAEMAEHAQSGSCVCWGIPMKVGKKLLVAADKPVTRKFAPVKAEWLVVLHTADQVPVPKGIIPASRGAGRLNEHAADYVFLYADGTEKRVVIRRRHQIGMVQKPWGENCLQAVAPHKPCPVPVHHEQQAKVVNWGHSQTRASSGDGGRWTNWLWAWKNPMPKKALVGIRVEPKHATIVVSAISAGKASATPIRWISRQKAVLRLPRGVELDRELDENGLFEQIQLDMGSVISVQYRPEYPNRTWAKTYNNALPEMSKREVLVEYTAHADARFHLPGGKTVPAAMVRKQAKAGPLRRIRPASQRVTLKVLEAGSKKKVAVKLHVHGAEGEYLAPVDRHRIPNPCWFEDYSCDFLHQGIHYCTYIDGETRLDLPLGRVFIEVSKGYEIRPVRQVVNVTGATTEIVVKVKKVLPWREAGWVSADTHVHFLSPQTAMLEGAGEGCNIVNLLASQWGELMTNVGDFDGKTTFGSKEAGGDGEYLVRVGTENRQHVMGHISLLGYNGGLIGPMTTGGPDESALGDPVGVLLTEWAAQCKKQDGVVVLPHFPNPRAEGAASIVSGNIDAVEMTSWGNLYVGIDPYSLSDWYRYLNCGYMVAAVGGTDKMSATTAVGTVRTYARIKPNRAFTYDAWKDAIRRGETFVTYGPLMEFAVEGKPAGSRIQMSRTGGTVDVTWKLASVTVPMSRIDLVVNGEIVESRAVKPWKAQGHFSVKAKRSSWIAILVRGHYDDQPEMIAAHSSPVMVELKGSKFHSAADALTILEQIEGALAFLDTVGTRAETTAYKRMRMVLTGAHRSLHNRMHRLGNYHEHTVTEDHAEHH